MAATERKPESKKTARPTPEIPDKLYFRIGEVARLLELPAYVLRFWESEFPQLKPSKGGTGQRLYRRRDVEMALEIRRLLYDEGYTIPGARQFLKTGTKAEPKPEPVREAAVPVLMAPVEATEPIAADVDSPLRRLKSDLRELSSLLSRPPAGAAEAAPPRRKAPNHRGLHVAARRRSSDDDALPLFGPHGEE